MKKNEKDMIDELLIGKSFLKSDMIYKRGYAFVKNILKMPEWDNPKFQGLLTSNIWNSNEEEVKKILEITEW